MIKSPVFWWCRKVRFPISTASGNHDLSTELLRIERGVYYSTKPVKARTETRKLDSSAASVVSSLLIVVHLGQANFVTGIRTGSMARKDETSKLAEVNRDYRTERTTIGGTDQAFGG